MMSTGAFSFACGCPWSGDVSVDEGRIVCAAHGAELAPFERTRVSRAEVDISFVLESASDATAEELADAVAETLLEHPGIRTVTVVITVERELGHGEVGE